MKKAFLIFFIAMISSIVSFGQLQEVKGVETKLTTYYNGSSDWFGFSFYNMNSIPVSIEAELHCIYRSEDKVIDVKTFNLKPGEEYIWKRENDTDFKVEYTDYSSSRKSIGRRSSPGWPAGDYSRKYYVKYKAYKVL